MTGRPCKVLMSAEDYAFGPVAKCTNIARGLKERGFETVFVGQGTALQYARSESAAFDRVLPLDRLDSLAEVTDEGYDLAISVMDPLLPVWAEDRGVRCLFVDSLFWFWGWDGSGPERQFWEDFEKSTDTLAARLGRVVSRSFPEAEYVAYRLSERACVQRSVSSESARAIDPELAHVSFVEAIVPSASYAQPADERRGCLVSLSGIRSPLMDGQMAEGWASTAVRFCEEVLSSSGMEGPVWVSGNSAVLSHLDIPSDWTVIGATSSEVHSVMGQVQVCLTPPGLTTMLESVSLGTPVVPLPAQHYGHERILTEFSRLQQDAFPVALTYRDLGLSECGDALQDTKDLVGAFVTADRTRNDAWDLGVTRLVGTLRTIADGRAAVLQRQEQIVAASVGSFGGTDQVCAVVAEMLGLSSSSKP